ncbi:endozepine-like protein [Beauveria bassiana ARSEF 2860]|uniref:Endozepine-like protein n=1 Tax=Beauveria bassiana (strain ARSEF 2860) TaxID=655819 RepID=J4W5F5_BEAB2|nr:endozepine-like protein [Beauveria bassiana ARSEF 2860]EJP65590.1 endozepine-like protein [Beauveria bassiana ARSEF 2860]
MADSVDRVFVHALNTVKKIPKTGASRPPPSERLRLYGLYKQAMEGDVDGVMEQPMAGAGLTPEELQRERDKWDAWNCQKGISRTEAKRRYIEALIETMHRYATTADGRELVSELEFVWNQIKHNSPSATDSSPQAAPPPRRFTQPMSGSDGPMKMLSPMSEQDEAELRSQRQTDLEDREMGHDVSVGSGRSQRRMERAITKLSAEVAAMREQISTGREWRSKKDRSFPSWLGWLVWSIMKHLLIDCVILSLILVWMRRRKDRRLEDLVRAALTLIREYVRNIVPASGSAYWQALAQDYGSVYGAQRKTLRLSKYKSSHCYTTASRATECRADKIMAGLDTAQEMTPPLASIPPSYVAGCNRRFSDTNFLSTNSLTDQSRRPPTMPGPPPPPGAPTSPKAMRRARSPSSSTKRRPRSPSPGKRNVDRGSSRRGSVSDDADADVVMGNTSEQPPTTAYAAAATAATVAAAAAAAEAQPIIPRLRSIAPAIFVPVANVMPSEEHLQKFAALAETNRVEHMRQALSQCNRHAAAVRVNFLTLFRRETARLMQLAAAAAAKEPPSAQKQQQQGERRGGWSATEADLERMLASMATPGPPTQQPAPQSRSVAQILSGGSGSGSGGGLRQDPRDVIGDVQEPSFKHRPAASPRELAARETLNLVGKATHELRSYETHIAPRREMRRRALDKEIAQRKGRVPPREVG